MNAVTIQNLSKTFPIPFRRQRVVAVKNVSFDVAEGEVYGLLGPNGSGKSTTLKILLGLVRPDVGSAMVFERASSDYRGRQDVGFLPENPYFYKFLTAEETLRFYGQICGMTTREMQSRISELLHLVGLDDARHRRVGGYSKGMLQRIGLAQALIQDPKLLILDEPTAGVDPLGALQIRDLILQLKSRGKTILLTSHLLGQVQEVCDRVGIMSRGEMVREGHVAELTEISSQTEFVVEGATTDLREKIQHLIATSGAHLVEVKTPQQSLEKVFLEATRK